MLYTEQQMNTIRKGVEEACTRIRALGAQARALNLAKQETSTMSYTKAHKLPALEILEGRTKALLEKNPTLSYRQAVEQVMREDPVLAERYRTEQTQAAPFVQKAEVRGPVERLMKQRMAEGQTAKQAAESIQREFPLLYERYRRSFASR